MNSEIVMSGISKKYNQQWILQDINQTFILGSSYGFMGHNEGGKSTLLRILSGLTAPTKGNVSCPEKLSISYVPDRLRPVMLTGRKYLRALGEIERIPFR